MFFIVLHFFILCSPLCVTAGGYVLQPLPARPPPSVEPAPAQRGELRPPPSATCDNVITVPSNMMM